MSTYLNLIPLLIMTFLFSACNSDNKVRTPSNSTIKSSSLKVEANDLLNKNIVIKTIHGNIIFKLYPNKAPNTSKRIMELVKKGFYNNLTFHRVIPGFVAQGGDPSGDGTGGSGIKQKAEFNDLQHILGTVAMARSNDPDSADSQFYIALGRLPHLDKKYTIFGQVISDFKTLKKIQKGDKMLSVSVQE